VLMSANVTPDTGQCSIQRM